MIKNFRHKGLKKFYESGNISGITATHQKRLQLILARLDAIHQPEDMNLPGLGFHKLISNLNNAYAVSVNKNWRIVFYFDGLDAYDVDYLDYH
jgi:proteic killer suppression protein